MAYKESTLLLFTYSFPYGTNEPFLETEIVLLASHYDKIAIIPMVIQTNYKRAVPDNVEIIDIPGIFEKSYERNILKKMKIIIQVLFCQFKYSNRKSIYVKQFRYYFSYLIHKINVAHELHHIISEKKFTNPVCYSYWFDYFMLPLSILKKEKKIDFLLSRAHGGDLYEYQHQEPDFFFPYRSFQLNNINTICPISLDGLYHLQNNYPLSKAKLVLSRLGVNGPQKIYSSPQNVPVIVSCSVFFGYKRVHLIPEILKHLSIKLKWIHIGDEGNCKSEVLELVKQLPQNIEVLFMGQMTNSQVLQFYETTNVSLFINVSKSEGIPVSIMEAISFGIPVIATNVGGIREIVNTKTGNLLAEDFSPKEVAELIEKNLIRYSSSEFRNGVRLFWENNYNAKKNYLDFIRNVLPS